MKKNLAICLLFLFIANATALFGLPTNPNATDRRSVGVHQEIVGLGALNDILQSFTTPSPLTMPWGVAHDGQYLYITDATGHPNTIYVINTNGTLNGRTITINEGQTWIGDMASDGTYLYACLVGGSNNIVKINIATGNVVQTISGDWNSTSQRGLAYDAAHNELYIGGWNSNMIWRVSASTGATISSFAFNGVSGLAWHPKGGPVKQGSLWVITNSDPSTIVELDPNNSWVTLKLANFPGGSYAGAGAEIDPKGALWVANQDDLKLYKIDLEEPISVPVASWAIVLAFLLILSFSVLRFRNIL
jgi:DNA-binding beta-propeller fold protein YncE